MARTKLSPLASDLRKFATKAPMKDAGPLASSLFRSDQITLLYNTLKVFPDPDEVLRKAGLTRASLRKLSFDDEIAQAIDTRRDAAINTPWRIEGASEDVNKFLTTQIEEHDDQIFSGCWSSRLYGYSVTQIVYAEKDAGRIGIGWVGEMPFEHYYPQRDGTVLYKPDFQAEPIPVVPEKYLVPIIAPTYSNPYGDALLSRLYWLWFFRTHGWQYWVQWLEQFGTPFLWGKTPSVIDPETNKRSVDVLASILDKSRRGSALAVDDSTTIEVIETKGTGTQFKGFDDSVTRQISKVILGQTLTSSEGEHGGNRALGQVHEEVRQDKKRADVKVLKRMGQRLVNYLWSINGFSGDVPMFLMEDEKGLQLDRAERDSNMVDKGMVIFTREYLKEVFDLDDAHFLAPGEDGFSEARGSNLMPADTVGTEIDQKTGLPVEKKKGKGPKAPPKANKQSVEFDMPAFLAALMSKDRARFTPDQEVIERGVEELTMSLPTSILAGDDIRQAIREASGPEDLAKRLAVVLQDSDINTFRTTLEKALLAAEVIGYVHAAERTGT